jgi:hypothetical protein
MDLLKGEQLPGARWTRMAKLSAMLCFAVACALLGASLLAPQTARVAGEGLLATGSVVGGR